MSYVHAFHPKLCQTKKKSPKKTQGVFEIKHSTARPSSMDDAFPSLTFLQPATFSISATGLVSACRSFAVLNPPAAAIAVRTFERVSIGRVIIRSYLYYG